MSYTTQNLNDGRYRIEHQMPQNGPTAVYEAYDTVSNVRVIVKEIFVPFSSGSSAGQEQAQIAFADQAQLLTRIRHDALLHVRDHFSEVGRQYLVLESVDGKTLADLLAENGSGFGTEEVMAWADQLLDALNQLHTFAPPIIHRGINPQHIKLALDGRIKLLAFGLSDGNGTRISTDLSSPSAGSEIGYSPLEQIWDSLDPASQKVIINSYDDADGRALTEPLTAAADIFAFGSTLYHLLTGKKPVDALERSIEILEGNADPLASVNELVPAVPFEVSEVIQKAMAIKSRERYDSAAIMRQVLKTAQVRARERVENEADETLEAAELIKQKQIQELLEQKEREIAEEQRRQAEILEQKLREAEEQRLAAERRAAEMERILKEKELENSIPPQAPTRSSETDLLDIPQPELGHTSLQMTSEDLFGDILAETVETPRSTVASGNEPPQNEAVEAVVETEPLAEVAEDQASLSSDNEQDAVQVEEAVVVEELLAAEEKISVAEPDTDVIEIEVEQEDHQQAHQTEETHAEMIAEPDEAPVVYDDQKPAMLEQTVSAAAYQYQDSYGEEYKQPVVSMPMIAGGVGLILCFVVLAGWYFLSSGSEPAAQPPAAVTMEPARSIEPPVVSQTPAAETVSQTTEQTEEPAEAAPETTSAITEQTGTATREVRREAARRPVAQNAARREPRPAPAERPAQRQPRKVTVDDLINDN